MSQAESYIKIVALGNSLMAGWGLEHSDSLPVQLESWLNHIGHRTVVINAGVSGDTTAGGLSRLNWVLDHRPDLVIVELGANDALRGIDPTTTYKNLDIILTTLKDHGIHILLTGMIAPPNLGEKYSSAFNPIYRKLAKIHNVMLYPFILDGVATKPELNQVDGMHPNAEGVSVIVKKLGVLVVELIENR